MTNERKEELELLCSRFRNQLIDLLHSIQTGHPGGSLSCTELLTALYFEIMNVDPEHPDMEGRDRLVLIQRPRGPIAATWPWAWKMGTCLPQGIRKIKRTCGALTACSRGIPASQNTGSGAVHRPLGWGCRQGLAWHCPQE